MQTSNTLRQLRILTITAMFAAIITVTTAYIFHIPIGSSGGYIHIGDAFLYIAAALLPAPYAMAAGAVGAGLADMLSGAMLWMPFTLVIKALCALCFTYKSEKFLCRRNIIALIGAAAITLVGYYLAEAVITQNLVAPVASVWSSVVQSSASALVFVVVGFALDKAHFKTKVEARLYE